MRVAVDGSPGRRHTSPHALSSILSRDKDGTVVRMGETRTRKKGIERLYKMLADFGPLERLAVLHTNAEADAIQAREHFKSFVKGSPIIINVTSIIGIHVGPNGLGFVAVTQ